MHGGPVETPCLVPNQTSVWICPIRAVHPGTEAMQHGLVAGFRIYLEYRSKARSAAVVSSAVKLALRVLDQTRVGIGPVRAVHLGTKTVQHLLLTLCSQLIDGSTADVPVNVTAWGVTSISCGPIQSATVARDQTANWSFPIAASGEAV